MERNTKDRIKEKWSDFWMNMLYFLIPMAILLALPLIAKLY